MPWCVEKWGGVLPQNRVHIYPIFSLVQCNQKQTVGVGYNTRALVYSSSVWHRQKLNLMEGRPVPCHVYAISSPNIPLKSALMASQHISMKEEALSVELLLCPTRFKRFVWCVDEGFVVVILEFNEPQQERRNIQRYHHPVPCQGFPPAADVQRGRHVCQRRQAAVRWTNL